MELRAATCPQTLRLMEVRGQRGVPSAGAGLWGYIQGPEAKLGH